MGIRLLTKSKNIKCFMSAIFSACLLQSCTLSDTHITAHLWKCGTPCGLQDVLAFDPLSKNTRLEQDTIYHTYRPVAIIIKREYRLWADNRLHIINIATKDTCIYYEK